MPGKKGPLSSQFRSLCEFDLTDLKKLNVSLTKHGAHKIARLIRHFPLDEVLLKTLGEYDEIYIDAGQAKKNLSTNSDDAVPALWAQAKKHGGKTLDYAVFLGIAFSHHALISALRNGHTGEMTGDLTDDMFPDRKSFTNFKNDLQELGLAKDANSKHVSYSFDHLFKNPHLPQLAAEIFYLKLNTADWDQKNDLVDECITNHFHEALAVSEDQFRSWLAGSLPAMPPEGGIMGEISDVDEAEDISEFTFRKGHAPKKTGTVKKSKPESDGAVDLLHNELQAKMYKQLCKSFGASNVGTEVPSGVAGTLIDAVVRSKDEMIFYEIKTAQTTRSCIREALPQLLEYSYWPNESRADCLIIVGISPQTENARAYLEKLRNEFSIPIEYRQIDRETGLFIN